jgi:hypothetical protein
MDRFTTDQPAAVLTNQGDGVWASQDGKFIAERTDSVFDPGDRWWTIKRVEADCGVILDETMTLRDARKAIFILMNG